jgi:PAS domain S-box-containing protein
VNDWRSMGGLLDQTGVFLWQVDTSLDVIFASRGFQALFDLTAAAIIGTNLKSLDWRLVEDREWSEAVAGLVKEGNSDPVLVELTSDDGVIFALRAEIDVDDRGALLGYHGTCQRAQSEEQDLSQWHDLAHAGADWFWELDAELRVSYLSANQEKVSGIPNSSFIGRSRLKFDGVDINDSLHQHMEDLEARKPFKDYTYAIEAPGGRTRWFRISGVPVFNEDGEFTGYRGVGRDFTDHQEALLASRNAEQMLLDAIELLPIGISIWDDQEKFVVSNSGLKVHQPDSANGLLTPGISLEEFTRAAAKNGFTPGALENEEAWVQKWLAVQREASGAPYENVRVDGSTVRLSAFRTFSGGYLVTSTDITELKAREHELQEAQTQLTDALESIDLGFAIYDADNRLTLANSAMRDMLPGQEHLLVPGTRFEDIVRAGALANGMPDVEGYVTQRLEMRRSVLTDKVVEIRPGKWKIVSESKSQSGGTVSIWTDITQLKEQEQALRETESRFSVAFHSSPLMMAIARLEDGGLVEVNDKFVEMTGYSRSEALANNGTNVSFIEEGSNRSELRSKLMRGQEIEDMEVVLQRKNGENFEALISGDIIDVSGEQRILMIGMDFSSHKKLENSLIMAKNEAEFANRSKSEFLANMSHELRTPLNAVIGFSEFLSNETFGPLGDPRYVEYVGDIKDSGTHLLNLINEILDVAKVEAGKMELRESEVDVDEMIVRSVRSVEGRALKSGLTIEGSAEPGLPFLRCDETKFRQILINVLGNAVKFTDKGGSIVVEGDLNDEGDMEIRVKDTGIGIAEEDMDSVFKVFGQAESSMDRRFEGAGLGLPLTKALVELHGGDFRLESKLGEGSTVYIIFPKDRLVYLD